MGRLDGGATAPIAIYLSPGANAVVVAKAVTDKLEEPSARLPEGVHDKFICNTAEFVEPMIEKVVHTLIEAFILVGIVVDDAIVVVENVEKVMEEEPHLSPAEATRKAMSEITAPIIAITLARLSVFVPVAVLPGTSGVLFRRFAITISASMVVARPSAR